MRITAVARNCRRGLPGRAVLAGTVTLAAVAAGLAAGGRPVQAAVRHHPHTLAPDTISSTGELTAVSAVSPTDVWVAGLHASGGRTAEPLVLHWNGKTWTTVSTPFLSRQVEFPVWLSAISPTEAWVAGSHGGNVSRPLILHCNGTACQQVPNSIPKDRDAALTGVSAVSPTDAWVTGVHNDVNGLSARLMLHWDGKTLARVATPAPRGAQLTDLGALSADSAGDAWASGSYFSPNGPAGPMMLHWNGSAWMLVKPPAIGGTPVEAELLSAVSPTDVWASVSYPPTSGDQRIMHWNGKTWTQVKIPANCTGDCVRSMSAVSGTDAWTVGFTGPLNGSLMILHCNGTTCQQVKGPVQAPIEELLGVSADSPTDAWAVGGYGSKSPDKILILHWDGKTWTQVSP